MNLALEFIWMHWTAAAFYMILCSPHCHAFLCLTTSLFISLFHCTQQTSSVVLFLYCRDSMLWDPTNCSSTCLVCGERKECDRDSDFSPPWKQLALDCVPFARNGVDQLFRGEWSLVYCLPPLAHLMILSIFSSLFYNASQRARLLSRICGFLQ